MKKCLVVAVLAVLSVSCAEPTNPSAQNALNPGAAHLDVSVASAGSVLPSAYASVMGTVNNNFPHSQKNLRYQQVFLGSDVVNPVIVGLCLRRDEILSPCASVGRAAARIQDHPWTARRLWAGRAHL